MSSTVCRSAAIALNGIEGTLVHVEAAVANQLPGMVIIGLPDAALSESKQRVRLATQQAGLALSDRLIVINLSPAALPKQGSSFDLAIALSALAASRQIPAARLERVAHIGELGLDGSLRRPPGLLSSVLAAKKLGFDHVMVPADCAGEAALVPDIEIIAAPTLRGAAAWHRDEADGWWIARVDDDTSPREPTTDLQASHDQMQPDMSDVIGQPEIVQALVVAAAGRHHISMIGPPGSGKTLLATRLVSILPNLSSEESIISSSIASLGGDSLTSLVMRPPFENPHHTSSTAALVGGGNSRGIWPGAITRACHGVLFLDEAPEFRRDVLDALRQPLESGVVEIQRSKLFATLPANVQLVIAANPCPCGNADTLDSVHPCKCTPSQRIRYLGRLSGPLTDRIDLRLNVRRVSSILIDVDGTPRSTSAQLREQVTAARARAAERLRGTPWRVNAEVPGRWLRSSAAKLPRSSTTVIDNALSRGALSVRGYDRVLRTSWTIADLSGKPFPERAEVRQALALREGVAA